MTVTVKMLVDKLKLKVVYGNEELLAKAITTADISRPGLEMTGYFDYYSPERLQLVGMKEWSYLKTMTANNIKLNHDGPLFLGKRKHTLIKV